MRVRTLSLILLVLFVFFCGCASKSKAAVYDTPYGKITEGATMPDVMGILGNPDDINVLPAEKAELWYYYFGEDSKIYVYFVNKKVSKVRDVTEEEEKEKN